LKKPLKRLFKVNWVLGNSGYPLGITEAGAHREVSIGRSSQVMGGLGKFKLHTPCAIRVSKPSPGEILQNFQISEPTNVKIFNKL